MTAPWLQRQLQTLLSQRGHALLLAGPSGLGQFELALNLARAWLCEQPGPLGACGTCASCHAIDVRTHAELLVLMPDVLALELNWPLDERTRDRIEKKEIKPSKWIRVEASRKVVEFSQTTRSRGATKVVLVYPADRLNTESANTLLKTLEEPAGALRFVLASEAVHLLPATVRSRCQLHAMHWPDHDEALAWMVAELAVTIHGAGQESARRELAQTCLRASGGRPADGLQWAAQGLTAQRWAGLPKALAAGDGALLADWPPARQLDVLQKLCHDLMLVAAGADPRFFGATDLPTPPSMGALQAWSKELTQATRTVEHPFNAGLALEAWLAQAQQVLAPKTQVGPRGRPRNTTLAP